jgi:hypothetical protein
MTKARLLFCFAAIVGVLALSAATASAEFTSGSGATTGKAKLSKIGTAFALTPGGAPVECAELSNGIWTIRTLTKQEPTKKGPHENFTGQFTKCQANLGGGITLPASVNSTCEVQVAQVGTSGSALTGAVTSACTVTITVSAKTSCVITIGTAGNSGLTKAKGEVIETSNDLITAAIGGITNTISAGCTESGLTNGNGKEGTFSGGLVAVGQTIA